MVLIIVIIPNGKEVKVNEQEVQHFMQVLDLTEEQAINTWLADHDYITDEEQEELDNKAKKVKIKHDAGNSRKKQNSKPRTVKTSDQKKELFQTIKNCLEENYANVEVLKENKLLIVTLDTKQVFKIDLIEQRKPKDVV